MVGGIRGMDSGDRNRGVGKLPKTEIRATIDSLSHDGRGIAHVNGRAVHLHGVLPHEEVLFTYKKRRRRFDEAVLTEVLVSSPERVEPKCPHFGVCGGCSLQHLAPEAQIALKQQKLLQILQQTGGVQPVELLSPLVAESPWGYRRKARLGVKYVTRKGRVLVGFRERNSSYVADMDSCEILHPKISRLIPPLTHLIDGLTIRDRLPQIEVAMGDECCVLIFRHLAPLLANDSMALLEFGKRYGIAIYTQAAGPDSVQSLTGVKEDLSYRLVAQNLIIHFQPGDFTQINSELNRLMVDQALKLLDPQPTDRILDLFCGVGNFTLPIARLCNLIHGVEGDANLVKRARHNARLNHIENCSYHTHDLYDDNDWHWLSGRFNKVLLDPPRSGAWAVLKRLPSLGVKRIVYVSCNPQTLARDAAVLVNQYGYCLTTAGVMDMFPHTTHVESIALFEGLS